MKILTFQEVEDILIGCTILSTGGGGALNEGLNAVKRAFDIGKEFKLLSFDDINEDAHYVNPYFCGSISPNDDEKEESEHQELVSAVKALEKYMNINFDGIISVEYGGGNTGQAMASAAMLDKYIVDCDAAGRAVPELQFSTYTITNKPIHPFSIATKYGDTIIVQEVMNDERAEAISRALAVATENTVGMADHPIKGEDLKTSVIPSALSYAGNVGKARREAVENGDNPIEKIIEVAKGYLLFNGKVNNDTQWDINDGFTIGTICINGINEFENQTFKIWYKNENMISWKNGKVFITCPDLICVLDNKTGYPITNPNCTENDEVAVLGFKAHELWKSKAGLELLNPNFFGFDFNYKSIEDVLEKK